MIEYDGLFWQRFYHWSVMSPTDRSMTHFGRAFDEVAFYISDQFTPIVRRAAWACEDFMFALSLADMTIWQRRWARLRYAIHRIARRFA